MSDPKNERGKKGGKGGSIKRIELSRTWKFYLLAFFGD